MTIQQRRWISWGTVSLMRFIVYLGLFLAFYLMMGIHNWTLYHVSRTTAIVILTWCGMQLAMYRTYGGYAVGTKKNKPIMYGMTLSTLGTDLVAYLALQIMNTNANHHATLMLFGPDFLPLLGAIMVQLGFLWLMIRTGNNLFFRMNPPKSCIVILGTNDEEQSILEKLRHFKLQWHVVQVLSWDSPDLLSQIGKAQVVMIGDLPEPQRTDIRQLCFAQQKDVLCKANLVDITTAASKPMVLGDTAFLTMSASKINIGQRIVKRTMDLCCSLLVLLVLWPLFVIIALAIKL